MENLKEELRKNKLRIDQADAAMKKITEQDKELKEELKEELKTFYKVVEKLKKINQE